MNNQEREENLQVVKIKGEINGIAYFQLCVPTLAGLAQQ